MGKLDYDKKKGVDMEKEQADIDNDVYGSYEDKLKVAKKRLSDAIVEQDYYKDSTPFAKSGAELSAQNREKELVRLVKSKKRK